jgi:hypothetical protein
MKKILFGLWVVCCCIASVSAQTFEGTFLMHVQDDNSVNMMNVSVRNDKLLLEPIDPTIPAPVKVLMSKNSDDIFVLTEQGGMKVAIKYTFEKPPVDSTKSTVTYKETGKTKKLEDFLCREVIMDDGAGHKLQLWVTSELGFTMADFSEYLGKFSAGLNQGDYAEAIKFNSSDIYKKDMALEVKEIKEKDATLVFIKKITRKKLTESDFTTDGYMVVDVKDLQGMGDK